MISEDEANQVFEALAFAKREITPRNAGFESALTLNVSRLNPAQRNSLSECLVGHLDGDLFVMPVANNYRSPIVFSDQDKAERVLTDKARSIQNQYAYGAFVNYRVRISRKPKQEVVFIRTPRSPIIINKS